jgi:hypothetical protein
VGVRYRLLARASSSLFFHGFGSKWTDTGEKSTRMFWFGNLFLRLNISTSRGITTNKIHALGNSSEAGRGIVTARGGHKPRSAALNFNDPLSPVSLATFRARVYFAHDAFPQQRIYPWGLAERGRPEGGSFGKWPSSQGYQ